MQKKDKIDKKAVILDGFDLLSKIKSPEKKIIKIVNNNIYIIRKLHKIYGKKIYKIRIFLKE